jgi:hypothetical protein
MVSTFIAKFSRIESYESRPALFLPADEKIG